MSDKAKEQHNNILLAVLGFSLVVAIVALIGFLALGRDPEIIQGEMEVEEYRVSGKVPGRILELRAKEGDFVKAGDTLAIIEAPEVAAKMVQAQSAVDAASAMDQMAQNGARKEQIQAAAQLLEQAKAGLEIAEKSYNRMKALYEEEVVSAQKFDEAEAMYKSAQAQVKAARSQYEMAVNGARVEERRAASATVGQARGAVLEVNSYIQETVQVAQMAGEVTDVYPKVGELVGTGTPIMSIALMDDQWATFNIREDQLKDLKVGAEITVKIPALDKETKMKVTSMKDKGSFAVWKATKASGQYDQKTFEVKARPTEMIEGIRPGMSVILKREKGTTEK
ncbi:MAG: HlyD family efflux transporter periplasmic adaptor subunit [Muribaculaceae bacterium]|nr:HlyD family efflux transporter periplasmic adaptor subunit [Muribaculaceae bacterium]MBQ3961858.1 HlyD family efflux transporter periplasmic adaptor subunit [Muribaculaceae bacterium]MBQ4006588.1 HlyD family efflux transporter periplasmic adaptor subunit [Muribaculaceae bacterium]